MDTESIFLELLRAGIWGRTAALSGGTVDWSAVFETARRQAVTAVVFDGMQSLPRKMLPQQKLLYQWFACVAGIESQNLCNDEDLTSLTEYFDCKGISSRLMKGQGCASFYPVPEHRQSGDIDLFVGEAQYEAAKQLVLAQKVKIEKESVYDAHFTWGKTAVEMHRWETFFYSIKLNRRLQGICRSEEWAEPEIISIRGHQIALFNPTFNAFYVFVHLYHHFMQVGVGLRQVCDWMLLLKRNEEEIDWDRLQKYVSAIKAGRAWKAFYGLAVEYLGLHLAEVPQWMENCNATDIRFVMRDILKVGNFGKFGASMQKRSFGKGILANMESFAALALRLFRISRFGYQEAFSYPLWRLFCDKNMFGRYKLKG